MLIKTSHQRADKGESPKSRRTQQVIKQKIAAQREHLMEQGANNTRPGDEDSLTRGVHEHTMHTALPTELTATKKKVNKEGLMVLE